MSKMDERENHLTPKRVMPDEILLSLWIKIANHLGEMKVLLWGTLLLFTKITRIGEHIRSI